MATAHSLTAVVVKDGVASMSPVSPQAFLETAPKGAYTVGRTVDYETVFEFEMHVQRMVTSISLMDKDGKHNIQNRNWHVQAMEKATDSTFMRNYMKKDMKQAIQHFSANSAKKVAEVQCAIKSRTNPNAKDSAWVRERKALDDNKPDDVDEILLLSSTGEISEGMSSNFFCMHKGELFTADGEDVLRGTVRALVLQVCQGLGITVRYKSPNITEASDWSGCFVTSTSRLVLPIDTLTCLAEKQLGGGKVIEFGACPQVDSIRREVKAHIRESCVQILG
ncbi:hypothetical protein SARC_00312 [Sphaeroforma arctica JP610]|uniref:Aminotransferase class IV n=1 Tax=Sphaeroforma arctica JP610 TaxID=667725 RepID=A0A0L0GF53_9EUKA|nr:hypothetical protein SARC_00312 [Sphaeroforma arctica JP610]KNC87612.1 hypothetical protein SARC_00312 [Sphaeroforma arctica JP610]|eukprot:XP_014161514.1 hypothetical protein SARC_00312 [Sphaeroforma arctica JP610]